MDDILKPQIQHIDGICYRINPGSSCPQFDQGAPQPYYEFDSECTGLIEPEIEENYEIEKDKNGRYITRFHVPKHFFSHIVGAKGSTKRRLEAETRTVLLVPKPGCSGDIVITGHEKNEVVTARQRVNMLVMSVRKKSSITHFLSLPLTDDIFQQHFLTFKNEILANHPDTDQQLFQSPCRLHLTITVLKLFDEIERAQAVHALEYCHKNIIPQILGNRRELRICMQGLGFFNNGNDPSGATVLYAKVTSIDEPSLLPTLLDAIFNYFKQQGLVADEKNNSVKIHVTLMNRNFLDKESSNVKNFNVTPILKVYSDYSFGEACISQIDLSTIGSSTHDEYWKAASTIDLFKY